MRKVMYTLNEYLSRYVGRNKLKLFCEGIGDPSNPTVLFFCGTGAHAHFWTDPFCQTLVQNDYFVIRFDHRDIGLSSAVDHEKEPYVAVDLAEDCIFLQHQR